MPTEQKIPEGAECLRSRMKELSEAIVVENNMLEAQERILEVHAKAGSSKNEEEVMTKVKDTRKRLRLMQDSKRTLSDDLDLMLAAEDSDDGSPPAGRLSTKEPAGEPKPLTQRLASKNSFRGQNTRSNSLQHLKLTVEDSIRVKVIEEDLAKEQMYLAASFNLLSQESTQANKKELLKAQTQYRLIKLRITSLHMEQLRITAPDANAAETPATLLKERLCDLERRTAIEAKVEEAAKRMMKMPSSKKMDKSKSPNSNLLSQWGQAHRRLDLLQLSLKNCKKQMQAAGAEMEEGTSHYVEQPPNLYGTVKVRVNEVKGMLNPRHLNDPSVKCQPFITLFHSGFHGRKDLTTVARPRSSQKDSHREWQWDKGHDKNKSTFQMEVEAVKEVEMLVHYSKDQLVGLAHVTLDRIIDGRMHALTIELHPQGYVSMDISFTAPNAPPAVTIKRRYAQKHRRVAKPMKKKGRTDSKNREGWRALKKFLASKPKDDKEDVKAAKKKKSNTMPRERPSNSSTTRAPSARSPSMDLLPNIGRDEDVMEPLQVHHRSVSEVIHSESDDSKSNMFNHVAFSPSGSDLSETDRETQDREEHDIDELIRQQEIEMEKNEPEPTDDVALINLSVDSFDLHAVLGMGNFGKVMLGEAKATGVLYALKFIKKDFIISEEEVAAVDMEKRIFMKATKANHPYIVKMYAGFQTEERVCFALEYAGGGDLMYHIHQGIFDEARAQFYSIECFMALEFLHAHGIIYRDLKLDNVLLDREGHVKLADFGLCKENMWEGDRTSTFCGTPEFIAPEILVDDTYTRAVDWWAYGVLVYEMMVGESPFPGEDEEEIFNSVLRENIVYPFFLNPDSNSLLRSLLVRKPDKRLGGNGDAAEVKNHAFFKKVDFDKYMARAVPPPFKPELSGPSDLRYFDPEFTSLPKRLTLMRPKLTTKDQCLFRTFSFVHQEFYVDKINRPIPRESIKKTLRPSYA